MSDARLRELWRRGRAGDVEARAQHLRERLRAGELVSTRLEVAARLGDPAARLALEAPPSPGADPVASLESLPDDVARRVALVCAQGVVTRASHWVNALCGTATPAARAVPALAAVLARPDEAALVSHALDCADELVDLTWNMANGGSDEAVGALRALAWAVRAAGPAAPAHAASALREAIDVARATDDAPGAQGDAEATLRDAVLDVLLAP